MPQLLSGWYDKQSIADFFGWSGVPDFPAPSVARLYYNAQTNTIHVIDSEGNDILNASIAFAFADAETPAGLINGVNRIYTTAFIPNPASSLQVFRNGILQTLGGNSSNMVTFSNGILETSGSNYNLSSNMITFTTDSIPQTGDTLICWYRYIS